jgi:hypothetical protein
MLMFDNDVPLQLGVKYLQEHLLEGVENDA